MSENLALSGRRILVAEDESIIADLIEDALIENGAKVIGRASSLSAAMNLARTEQRIDGAVLDINLAREMVFPAADVLLQRHVPIVFLSGYGDAEVPSRFARSKSFKKPFSVDVLVQELALRIRLALRESES